MINGWDIFTSCSRSDATHAVRHTTYIQPHIYTTMYTNNITCLAATMVYIMCTIAVESGVASVKHVTRSAEVSVGGMEGRG